MKAYSGLSGLGQSSTLGLLIKYFAERISISIAYRTFAPDASG